MRTRCARPNEAERERGRRASGSSSHPRRWRKKFSPPSVEYSASTWQVLEVSDGLIEELCDMVVEERVVNVPTGTAPGDEAKVPQQPQMV